MPRYTGAFCLPSTQSSKTHLTSRPRPLSREGFGQTFTADDDQSRGPLQARLIGQSTGLSLRSWFAGELIGSVDFRPYPEEESQFAAIADSSDLLLIQFPLRILLERWSGD